MESLFNDYEKIILFATLGEDIFSVDEVRFTDDGFFPLYFFFIDTDSIGFQSSAGFSFGRHDGCFIG